MTEVTKTAYARMKGVSHTAINKAVDNKRIVKGWNPTTKRIIVELADLEFGSADNAQKLNSAEKKQDVNLKPKNETRPIVSDPEKEELINQLAVEEGLRPEDLKVTAEDGYGEAKTKHTKVQFLLDKAKLLKVQGSLLDKDQVQSTLFSYANQLKRALQTMAQRITANMRAAATELDAQLIMQKEVNEVLEKYASGVDLTQDEN